MSVIPVLSLTALQIGFSYLSVKNDKIRKAVDGSPSVIINRGKVNFKEMLKQRYNLDDLLTQLRNQSVKSIEEVDYAILETSGKLSIFKKSDDILRDYPLPLILDGVLDEETLLQIHKSKNWLDNELRRENVVIENIFYAFYKDNKLYIIEKDKIK